MNSIKVFKALSRKVGDHVANDVCVLLEERIELACQRKSVRSVVRELELLVQIGDVSALREWKP